MRILLVGEYSRLHNSLKEGLTVLGHEVKLVGDGDGFKQFPCDYSFEAAWCNTKIVNAARQVIFRIFKYDIAGIERGIRFYFLSGKLKDFDVVQLINEAPVKTIARFERHLLKQLFAANKKVFLLSCGIDYISTKYMLEGRLRYSLMDPYFKNPALKVHYRYVFDYTTAAHKKLHDFVLANIKGIIASDIDYVLPLQGHPIFLGLAPNPVNTDKIKKNEAAASGKVIIFLGINKWTYHQKGIAYFEKALEIITLKYPGSAKVIIAENLPYAEYIKVYDSAHILLDQVYGYDQGYNALEAMAKGKVAFTGAEQEFTSYYNLAEPVAINALPDVDALVAALSYLIENPGEITAIGERAKAFIDREHNYIKIAGKYIGYWTNS